MLPRTIESLDSLISLMFCMDKWTSNHPEYNISFLVGKESFTIEVTK